ncbi:hypothetical protein FA95DRAFT_72012 [Auriscalpium vulgare]|uniref:Uncharacterized protein n=1 Tax=Auriscalpium vulgare TaxID=40419 RepID=A0ACB8RPE8_9AGAM|nr:hypothetical protein FA95DRAFT_72012 [Auriscalpium vulgare]
MSAFSLLTHGRLRCVCYSGSACSRQYLMMHYRRGAQIALFLVLGAAARLAGFSRQIEMLPFSPVGGRRTLATRPLQFTYTSLTSTGPARSSSQRSGGSNLRFSRQHKSRGARLTRMAHSWDSRRASCKRDARYVHARRPSFHFFALPTPHSVRCALRC